MDPRLAIFLAVARLGQITRAGRRLNLSPSAVSSQIVALERELGATLFVRGSRGMRLTASGHTLYAAAEQIEALWTKTARDVQAEQQGAPRVRIAASHTAAELFLPRPLGRFRAQWPDTLIHLVMTNSQTVVERVTGGTVDIGVIEGGPVRGEIRHERLWTDQLTLIVSVRHPLATLGSVSVSELAGLDWILREEGSGTRRVFERALEHAGFSPHELNVMMQLASLRAILAMVANNVGVSVVSRAIFAAEEIALPGIVGLPIRGLDLSRTLEAVLPAAEPSSRAARLLAYLRADARGHTGAGHPSEPQA